jgi:hypothetical protein
MKLGWLRPFLPSALLVLCAFLLATVLFALLLPLISAKELAASIILFLIGYALYAGVMKAIADAIDRTFERYQLAPDLYDDGLERTESGDRTPAPLPEARRVQVTTGLPKFPVRGYPTAPQMVSQTTLYEVTFFEANDKMHSILTCTANDIGTKTGVEIKAWIDQDLGHHRVRISPTFDLRLWNLEQRRTPSTTVAALFPRYLLRHINGIIV